MYSLSEIILTDDMLYYYRLNSKAFKVNLITAQVSIYCSKCGPKVGPNDYITSTI